MGRIRTTTTNLFTIKQYAGYREENSVLSAQKVARLEMWLNTYLVSKKEVTKYGPANIHVPPHTVSFTAKRIEVTTADTVMGSTIVVEDGGKEHVIKVRVKTFTRGASEPEHAELWIYTDKEFAEKMGWYIERGVAKIPADKPILRGLAETIKEKLARSKYT